VFPYQTIKIADGGRGREEFEDKKSASFGSSHGMMLVFLTLSPTLSVKTRSGPNTVGGFEVFRTMKISVEAF
jgi:hypothetical protein